MLGRMALWDSPVIFASTMCVWFRTAALCGSVAHRGSGGVLRGVRRT